jgi:hypothetical protein
MDIERWVVDAATLYFLWQGNRIFAQQGPPVPPPNWRSKVKNAARYWPIITMAFLAVAIWAQPFVGPFVNGYTGHQDTLMTGLSLSGDMEIPAASATASVNIPVERPYRVDSLSTTWGSTATLSNRDNGVNVSFASPAPLSGGKLHWSLIAGDASPQIQLFPSSATSPQSDPTPLPGAANEDTRAHQLAVDWKDFHPAWPLELANLLRAKVRTPCVLRLSTAEEHLALRDVLHQIATGGNLCTIADDDDDKIPSRRDKDAETVPSSELFIHWDPQAQPNGILIAEWFQRIGFNVDEGHHLPPNSNRREIWIDIGSGILWKKVP